MHFCTPSRSWQFTLWVFSRATSGPRYRIAACKWRIFCRVLGKPRSLSAARILCKHDKFCGVDAEWDPQMRRRYFYCLRRFEGSHLIRDAVSTLCLISDRVLWNPKFTTAVEGWEPWARSRRAAARNTFVTDVSWQGTFGKNSACQIAATRSIDSKIVDRSAFVNHVALIVQLFFNILINNR